MAISMALSAAAYFLLSSYAEEIASGWLMEPDAAPLLKIIALTYIPCCIHACINGYYYGQKKTAVPSACQFIEQLARVFFVWLMYMICKESGRAFDITFAVWGLVVGEIASTLLSLTCISLAGAAPGVSLSTSHGTATDNATPGRSRTHSHIAAKFRQYSADILRMAAPLTAGRAALSIFAASENALIPARLRDFGYNSTDALAIYGILTGMSLSVVMFPSVLTNSASVLLMPAVSEAHTRRDIRLISKAIQLSFAISLTLGFICIVGFTLTGSFIGNALFENDLAGAFIKTLAWICPFMYMNATFNSILNGLGRPTLTFIHSIISCTVRIMFVQFAVPVYGIKGYLYGIVISHMIAASLAAASVYRFKNEKREH
jgi:stage V sporulation protein B